MKKINRALHLLLMLSLVLLPMRAVVADFSAVPQGAEIQVEHLHSVTQSHAAVPDHDMLMADFAQKDTSSTDCHEHNLIDCEACALHFTLKSDVEIGGFLLTATPFIDYSVPVVTLVLSSEIRPPII